MSGQVLGTTTTVPGVAGVALLPSTGSTRPLFIAAAVLLASGIITLIASSVIAAKNRA